jgi:excisionase family DNA binding protein
MTGDFESALRGLLKSTIQEVIKETLGAHVPAVGHPSGPPDSDERFLLRPREAAERLAISERQLFSITKSGLLPCVRVGRLVRYSTETIRQWIRNTESSEVVVVSTRRSTSKPNPITVTVPNQKKPRQKTTPARTPGTAAKATSEDTPRKETAAPRQHKAIETKSEERVSPFSLLLKELGVERTALPSITNGDLMRIAEVDIPTLHSWIYHGRELPEAALNKLREHFAAYRAEQS